VNEFSEVADLAVVIPVHNRRSYTATCLRHLRALDGRDFMVVVADDGSSDGTAEYLEEEHPDVHVVRGDGDLWWSGGVDRGCRFAFEVGASWVLLLNNDTLEMSADLIPELERVRAAYGGLAGAVIVEDRSPGCREIVAAGGTADWRGRGLELREGPRYAVEFRSRAEDVDCDWLSGAALAFGRDVFDAIGGFDVRRFPQYRGDADFTMRARAAGYRCVVTYAAWVLNDTTDTWINFRRRLTYREFLLGFVSLKSAYSIPETVRFAWRHCPKRWLPRYLVLFYLRYAYAFWKTRHRLPPDVAQPRLDASS
jgi:GT2 family glycosyltransferase